MVGGGQGKAIEEVIGENTGYIPNVFSATGGFIWLHILYLCPCLIQMAL